MIIDVWSDVVCPWCFIGKRRLENALQQFAHKEEVIVRHRAFQLQPNALEVVPMSEHLAEKYRVSSEEVKQMQANVCAVADGEGLCYNFDQTLSGNTFDAHRALAFAATKGKQSELLEAMYSGYFEKSLPLFSHQDICRIAETVDIDANELKSVLESDQFEDSVLQDRKIASELGATGVPFFVIDMKYGISGAQPLEIFKQTIQTAWDEQS